MIYELKTRIRDYFRFSFREQKEILLSAIIFGFILSFRKWGVVEFDFVSGIKSFIFATIAVLIAIVANVSVQKVFALRTGYKMHYYWWFQGTIIGVFITFISFGFIPVLYPGTTYFEAISKLRLGIFRYGMMLKEIVFASVMGIVSNMILVLFASFLYLQTNNDWVMYFININLIFAFFTMLPLPKVSGIKIGEGATTGFNIYFFSRQLYIFLFATLIAYALLIYFAITILGSFLTLFIALIIGLIGLYFFVK